MLFLNFNLLFYFILVLFFFVQQTEQKRKKPKDKWQSGEYLDRSKHCRTCGSSIRGRTLVGGRLVNSTGVLYKRQVSTYSSLDNSNDTSPVAFAYKIIPLCTVVLVNQMFVLTSAYCGHRFNINKDNLEGFYVAVGTPHNLIKLVIENASVRKVVEFIVHPVYREKFRKINRYDAALVKVNYKFEIDLGKQDDRTAACFRFLGNRIPNNNKDLYVAGYGNLISSLNTIPKFVDLDFELRRRPMNGAEREISLSKKYIYREEMFEFEKEIIYSPRIVLMTPKKRCKDTKYLSKEEEASSICLSTIEGRLCRGDAASPLLTIDNDKKKVYVDGLLTWYHDLEIYSLEQKKFGVKVCSKEFPSRAILMQNIRNLFEMTFGNQYCEG